MTPSSGSSRPSARTAIAAMLASILTASACGGTQPAAAPASAPSAAPPIAVQVVVPDPDNLQWMTFWTALGAGFFKEEGLDVRTVSPDHPAQAAQFFFQGKAQVAVFAPPQYIGPITQKQPIVLFANLLRNDPINVIVRADVAAARKLSPNAPLSERLQGMRGLKVGVAPGPPPRLRTLFKSVGMDADRDIEIVVVDGDQQNEAFTKGRIDALYAHTPYLERALVRDAAVLLVNQSRGDVPELVASMVHALATTRAYAADRPAVLGGMARAIYRAQQLVHTDLGATAEALLRSGVPGLERKLLDALLPIYQGAVPKTPEVSIKGIEDANRQYSGHGGKPVDLSGVRLDTFLAPQFAEQAVRGTK